MYWIGLCDDRETERDAMRRELKAIFAAQGEAVTLVDYASGEALLADLEDGEVHMDLLFLDIYMDGMNGIEAARRVRELDADLLIVFLTTSPDHALESYDVDAAGYLLKPPPPEKLRKLLTKLVFSEQRRRQVTLRCGRELRYIYLDEVLWAESSSHISTLYLTDGQQLETRTKLDDLEKIFSDPRFLRCHQSFLVNMDHIANVRDGFQMKNGGVVPIRVRTKKQMTDAYYRYFVSKV